MKKMACVLMSALGSMALGLVGTGCAATAENDPVGSEDALKKSSTSATIFGVYEGSDVDVDHPEGRFKPAYTKTGPLRLRISPTTDHCSSEPSMKYQLDFTVGRDNEDPDDVTSFPYASEEGGGRMRIHDWSESVSCNAPTDLTLEPTADRSLVLHGTADDVYTSGLGRIRTDLDGIVLKRVDDR